MAVTATVTTGFALYEDMDVGGRAVRVGQGIPRALYYKISVAPMQVVSAIIGHVD